MHFYLEYCCQNLEGIDRPTMKLGCLDINLKGHVMLTQCRCSNKLVLIVFLTKVRYNTSWKLSKGGTIRTKQCVF